jgi:hypothetical protein
MSMRRSWPDPWQCTVEVLVVPGCPGTELAIARVNAATEALGIATNVRLLTVREEAHAMELGFVGSPTVRVDGQDVEEGASVLPVGISCRVYREREGAVVERAPPLAWIHAALARNAPLAAARASI